MQLSCLLFGPRVGNSVNVSDGSVNDSKDSLAKTTTEHVPRTVRRRMRFLCLLLTPHMTTLFSAVDGNVNDRKQCLAQMNSSLCKMRPDDFHPMSPQEALHILRLFPLLIFLLCPTQYVFYLSLANDTRLLIGVTSVQWARSVELVSHVVVCRKRASILIT
jgi:hypothetical protein